MSRHADAAIAAIDELLDNPGQRSEHWSEGCTLDRDPALCWRCLVVPHSTRTELCVGCRDFLAEVEDAVDPLLTPSEFPVIEVNFGLITAMTCYDLDGQPIDIMEWGRMRVDGDDLCRVDRTEISDDMHVSTVWLGIEHGFVDGRPLIFETMIFGGQHDEWCERYTTIEEARAGHQAAVAMARGATQ